MNVHPKRLKDIRGAFTAMFPLAPFADAEPIRQRACRSEMNSLTPDVAVWLSAIAHLRHEHTDYDALLAEGYDRDSARYFVIDEINSVLTQWRAARFLSADEDDQFITDDQPKSDADQTIGHQPQLPKTIRRARVLPQRD
jgi:hypothetical protein